MLSEFEAIVKQDPWRYRQLIGKRDCSGMSSILRQKLRDYGEPELAAISMTSCMI